MDTDQSQAQEPATTDEGNGMQPTQMREMFRSMLDRVIAQTNERPILALAAAGGVGYVMARGLPRMRGLLGLLGVGGLVGYGITAMRARMAGNATDTQDDGANQSTSGDAAFGGASSRRNRSKKKNDATTAS